MLKFFNYHANYDQELLGWWKLSPLPSWCLSIKFFVISHFMIFRYKGLLDAIQKIHMEEGTKKFYRGFVPTMLGIVPYAGLSFLTYETCKGTYRKWTDGNEPNSMYRMLFGACAGFVGQSTTYPLDIVRRRMQTDGTHGDKNPEYRNIISTVRSVLRNEGLITGLYKGLSMNWVKGPIAVGISFTTYDFFHEQFQKITARSQ